jgi:hypothetical protein
LYQTPLWGKVAAMPDLWSIAVALVVDQIAIAIATVVALLLPLTNPYAQWAHKNRGVFLVVGIVASIVPVVHFASLFITGEAGSIAIHLVASLVWVVVQFLLYFLESKRHLSQRSPVK